MWRALGRGARGLGPDCVGLHPRFPSTAPEGSWSPWVRGCALEDKKAPGPFLRDTAAPHSWTLASECALDGKAAGDRVARPTPATSLALPAPAPDLPKERKPLGKGFLAGLRLTRAPGHIARGPGPAGRSGYRGDLAVNALPGL